jgi:hypothetical protein
MDKYGLYLDTDGEVFLHCKHIRCDDGGYNGCSDYKDIALGFDMLYVQSAARHSRLGKAKLVMSEEELWRTIREFAISMGDKE